jgi:hypothetical protein
LKGAAENPLPCGFSAWEFLFKNSRKFTAAILGGKERNKNAG